MSKLRLVFFSLVFLLVGCSAQAYYNPGQPTGFVNDFSNILTTEQKANLETKLSQLEKDSSNQISVVIINSLDGDTVENFAVQLFADWGIGQAKEDNGALLLIAMDDRQMRIEVGYGLEGALTDAQSSWIIRDLLKPNFQDGNYYQGIDQAVDRMIALTKGEYQGTGLTKVNWRALNPEGIFWLILIAFYLLTALRRYFAKTKAWWPGGVIGLIIGLIIALIFFRAIYYFIILPVSLGVAGLIFDYLASRVLPPPKPPRKGGGIWFLGGGGGSGGRGGGGFGGFGGGMSGGGGASGRW